MSALVKKGKWMPSARQNTSRICRASYVIPHRVRRVTIGETEFLQQHSTRVGYMLELVSNPSRNSGWVKLEYQSIDWGRDFVHQGRELPQRKGGNQYGEWTPSRILHLAEAGAVEFVVRACNAHDDLVAALDQILDDLGGDDVCCCRATKDTARAALAKARGEA